MAVDMSGLRVQNPADQVPKYPNQWKFVPTARLEAVLAQYQGTRRALNGLIRGIEEELAKRAVDPTREARNIGERDAIAAADAQPLVPTVGTSFNNPLLAR